MNNSCCCNSEFSGKKIKKTGVNKVPKPKPEKKVRIEIKKASIDITKISIIENYNLNIIYIWIKPFFC
tara:strand:- start:3779 stop:3982 length:204 start_codon:yes stop_codon:yes gene_type:complete